MERNYWQEYWNNYYNFMAYYLREVQRVYGDEDIKKEYLEVSKLFEPSTRQETNQNYNSNNNMPTNNSNNNQQMNNNNNNSAIDNTNSNSSMNENNNVPIGDSNSYQQMNDNNNSPTSGSNNNQQMNNNSSTYNTNNNPQNNNNNLQTDNYDDEYQVPYMMPGVGQSPDSFISTGGGQFSISNCRRMAIVRVVMRRGFNPSNFYMIVNNFGRRDIQGYRIDSEDGNIRFLAMAVEYKDINLLECVF